MIVLISRKPYLVVLFFVTFSFVGCLVFFLQALSSLGGPTTIGGMPEQQQHLLIQQQHTTNTTTPRELGHMLRRESVNPIFQTSQYQQVNLG